MSAGIAAGKTRGEIVESARMKQYSHFMEYKHSRAGNVAVAYEMLSARPRR